MNFQHYFQIKFLSSPKKMKNCIPSNLFLDIWLQKLSSCYVSLSNWLTTIFVNPWKNQKYLFVISLFTSLLQMELFLRNNIVFTKTDMCSRRVDSSCCDCAAEFRNSRLEGFWKVRFTINFSRDVHFLVRAQITGLQCWKKWTCSRVFFNNFNYLIGNLS